MLRADEKRTRQGLIWEADVLTEFRFLSWHTESSSLKLNEQAPACGRQGDCGSVEIPRGDRANDQKFSRQWLHPAPSLVEQFQMLQWWQPTAAHQRKMQGENSLNSHLDLTVTRPDGTIKQTHHYLTFSSPDDGLSFLSVQTKHAEWFACKFFE